MLWPGADIQELLPPTPITNPPRLHAASWPAAMETFLPFQVPPAGLSEIISNQWKKINTDLLRSSKAQSPDKPGSDQSNQGVSAQRPRLPYWGEKAYIHIIVPFAFLIGCTCILHSRKSFFTLSQIPLHWGEFFPAIDGVLLKFFNFCNELKLCLKQWSRGGFPTIHELLSKMEVDIRVWPVKS